MRIQVTQEDINLARKRIKQGFRPSENCPLQLAISRYINKIIIVGLTSFFVLIDKIGNSLEVQLPANAISFRNEFDANRDVVPFEFEINYK